MSKILFLVPRMNIGGAETYVYTVAKELHKRGEHEVFVVSAGGMLSDELESMGVKTFFVPVRFSRRFCSWIATSMLKNIIKKYDIDIVHANSGDAGCIAAELKKVIDIPVVYTAHGRFGNIEREYVINTLDKIICVSNFVRNQAITQNFDKDRLVVRYNGIDLDRFVPDQQLYKDLREKYEVSEDTLVLITASRIKNLEHKGHGDMISLFKEFAANENWKLFIIGKGEGFLRLKYEIKKANLSEKIVCLGHRLDVHRILNIADVYISPTKAETFGLSIAEALAVGKPAVVYAVGGTPEVINDGISGLLVKKEDVKSMYEKIKYLDTNRNVLKNMSTVANSWVKENFSKEKMIEEIEKIYFEVLCK